MKLITSHISDTHNDTSFLAGEGNLLFHTGDATLRGTEKEFENFGSFLRKQLSHFDHIVYIPGNHDKLFESNETLARSIIEDPRIHVLINQSLILENFKIYGSPYSITYGDRWSFMKHGDALFNEWEKIPKDVEILLTHSPPFGILDYVNNGHLGCQNLMYRIETEFSKLILHCFGHIHESNGLSVRDNRYFLNSSIAGSYLVEPSNAWILEWEDKTIVSYEKIKE